MVQKSGDHQLGCKKPCKYSNGMNYQPQVVQDVLPSTVLPMISIMTNSVWRMAKSFMIGWMHLDWGNSQTYGWKHLRKHMSVYRSFGCYNPITHGYLSLLIWGFPKMVVPNKHGFSDLPTKNDYFGVFWRYHHWRKHPPIYVHLGSLGGKCGQIYHRLSVWVWEVFSS